MNFSCCVTWSASHEHRVQLSPALGNWIRVRSALLLHCWASLTLLFALLAYPFVSHAATFFSITLSFYSMMNMFKFISFSWFMYTDKSCFQGFFSSPTDIQRRRSRGSYICSLKWSLRSTAASRWPAAWRRPRPRGNHPTPTAAAPCHRLTPDRSELQLRTGESSEGL